MRNSVLNLAIFLKSLRNFRNNSIDRNALIIHELYEKQFNIYFVQLESFETRIIWYLMIIYRINFLLIATAIDLK